MKRLLSVLLALSLVAAGCAKKSEVVSRAAALVPSDALAYVTVSLDPAAEQKRTLQGICAKFKKLGQGDCDVAKLLDELFGDMGLSYERDVKPWIGEELAFALLPPARSGGDPLTVLLVAARDTDVAEQKLKAASGKDDEIDHRVVGGYVVIDGQKSDSNRTAALDRIQAQSTGDQARSLARDTRFTGLAAKVHSPHLVLGWVDATRALELLGSRMGSMPIPGLDRLLPDLTKEKVTAAFSLYAEADGLALEGLTEAGKPASAKPETGGAPVLTEGLPANTFAALTAFGVGPQLDAAAGEGEAGKQFTELLDQVRTETGLDVRQDLTSWMGGEIVLAAGPPSGGPFPEVGLIVEPTDKAKAAAGVAKIKAAVEDMLGVRLIPISVGGTTGYALAESPMPGLTPAMVLFPDRFVIASSPKYLEALSKPATPSFGSTDEYKRIAGSGGKVSTQFLVRLGAVRDAVVGFLGPEDKAGYDKDVAPWLEPLESLLVRVAPGDAGKLELKITTR